MQGPSARPARRLPQPGKPREGRPRLGQAESRGGGEVGGAVEPEDGGAHEERMDGSETADPELGAPGEGCGGACGEPEAEDEGGREVGPPDAPPQAAGEERELHPAG